MITPIEVFCCYAQEDLDMLRKLKQHLRPLEHDGLITVWCDLDLNIGQDWRTEFYKHFDQAYIILLLISSAFTESTLCQEVKAQALARSQKASTAIRWADTPQRFSEEREPHVYDETKSEQTVERITSSVASSGPS